MSDTGTLGSISFFQKNETVCPICEHHFKKEELRVGGGRLIAGPLGNDLRRYYEASKKFGDVYPLIYYVMTCPGCYYSTLGQDFGTPDPKAVDALRLGERERRQAVDLIFPTLDWENLKTLKEGAAGYFLAAMCYQHFSPSFSPTIKSGICSLRAAWCFADLHRRFPTENFDYLERIFYHKARFYYSQTIDRDQSGEEALNAALNFGPDVDNNFGFDSVMYLLGYLEYHYGSQADTEQRERSLTNARRAIARLVGMGKSSKNKPTVLIEKAKDLHKLLGEEIKE
jgi:uncharacterized protein (DUF2225 family)